jgi:hypothetical protein
MATEGMVTTPWLNIRIMDYLVPFPDRIDPPRYAVTGALPVLLILAPNCAMCIQLKWARIRQRDTGKMEPNHYRTMA